MQWKKIISLLVRLGDCENLQLLHTIEELQRNGHFPEGSLKNMQLLPASDEPEWDIPVLIDLSSCWERNFQPEDIWHAGCTTSLSTFDVLRDGEKITDSKAKEKAISACQFQTTRSLADSDIHAKFSLMNMSLLSKFNYLRPSRALRNRFRIINDRDISLLMNIASAGTFVDFHIGVSLIFSI